MHWLRFRILIQTLFTTLLALAAAEAAVIRGHVYQYSGGPVAPYVDVKVTFRPAWDVTTDADGRFTMNEVTPGRWNVVCRPDGYLPAIQAVEVVEGDTLDIELVLRPRIQEQTPGARLATLKVFVVGGPEGLPLANQAIRLRGNANFSETTNRVGRAEFTNLPPGNYMLSIQHPQYGADEKEISVPPGGVILEQVLSVITASE